jgi:LysM repeat protein
LDDVPPLNSVAAAPTADATAAPAWGGAQTGGAVASPIDGAPPYADGGALATTTSDVSTNPGIAQGALPAVPAIPELPATTGEGQYTAAPHSVPIPNELPQNIPVAQYPDTAATGATAAPPYQGTVGGASQYQVPPEQAAPQAGIGTTGLPAASQGVTSGTQNGLPTMTNVAPDASQQLPVVENPLRQSASPAEHTDPYASNVQNQPQTTASTTPPGTPSFAASLPAIQMALERRELARALELLTPWHNDPSLAPADAERVEALLGQLAGTVVYSTEHQLEPARSVKAGETLETIAKEYNVPWQLLAKINGIPAADQVRPGQELKVLRGPFSAVVDLSHKELTLTIDGRYAGKFAVAESTVAPVAEGEWTVSSTTSGVMLARANAPLSTPLKERATFLGPIELSERLGIPAAVGLSEADTQEVADILSVGSRVVIRR